MRDGRHSHLGMPPHLSVGGRWIQRWSNFSLWLNWCAVRCRRLHGAGGAAACSAPRAASGAARNAPNREIGLTDFVIRNPIHPLFIDTGSGMSNPSQAPWPELPTAAWRDTYATLHLWTQIVGKIRLTKAPWLNHSWHVTLYVTPRGLTTSPVPDGTRTFQIDFDFIDHVLRISTSDGAQRQFALAGQSVASFYAATMAALAELGIAVTIDEMPNELPDPVRFSRRHRARLLRSRCGRALSADPRQLRSRLQAIPHRLPRQGEPGAFLLGQLRSGGDALLRTPRAAPSRRRAAICPMRWPTKPIRTRSAAPASGRAAARSIIPRSIPMPIRSRRAFAPRRCGRTRRSSAKRSANSSCPMMPCARLTIPTRRCWISCKAPMRPRRIQRNGIATRWNATRPARRGAGTF